jgi:hypothetical protein
MKKIALAFIFTALIAVFSQAEDAQFKYELSKNDITDFLLFADSYVTMAGKYIPDAAKQPFADLVFSDNKKLYTATENFLKGINKNLKLKGKWDYPKLITFITTVSIGLDAVNYYDEWGYPEETGGDATPDANGETTEDSSLDPYKDIPKEVLDLAKANKASLGKYFPATNNPMENADENTVEDNGNGSDNQADNGTQDAADEPAPQPTRKPK